MNLIEVEAHSLNKLLDQAAHTINAARPTKAVRSFYASSGYSCGLQLYWQRTGQTPTNSTYNPEWNDEDTELGNTLHNIIQSRLVASGRVVMLPAWEKDKANGEGLQPAVEVPLNEKTLTPASYQRLKHVVGLGARPDTIVNMKSTREDGTPHKVYFEIKTCEYYDFDNPFFKDKQAGHEWQVLAILEGAEFPTIGKLDYGLLYYVSRGKSPHTKSRVRRLYQVMPRPEFMQGEFDRLARLNALVLSNGPQPSPEPGRGKCRFCSYRDLCPAPEGEKNGKH